MNPKTIITFIPFMFLSVSTQACHVQEYECKEDGNSKCKPKSERCGEDNPECEGLMTSYAEIICRKDCAETQKWCELSNKCIPKLEKCECGGEKEMCTDDLNGQYACSKPKGNPFTHCEDGSCRTNCTSRPISTSSAPPISTSSGPPISTSLIIIGSLIGTLCVILVISVAIYFCCKCSCCTQDTRPNNNDRRGSYDPVSTEPTRPVKETIQNFELRSQPSQVPNSI